MTLDEKLSMLIGSPGAGPAPGPGSIIGIGFIPGVPRLGIPPLRFTDGPAGVRIAAPAGAIATTALPAPVALAATFSQDSAARYGAVLGRESQARGQDVLFGPVVNNVRVPQGGRTFEALGEDPSLTSQLAQAEVTGIQGQGTIATVKHLAENNQEAQRNTINVNVDERTLHEIELPGFQSAVNAGVGSVMCALNSVNGEHACENTTLLTDILRSQWAFQGFVVSDYAANHSAAPALTAGLDIEFVSTFFTQLKTLVENGSVPVSVVNNAVSDILSTMGRFGLLKNASSRGGTVKDRARPAINVEGDAQIALKLAENGAVLMKNDAGTLPLERRDVQSLAVIGPTARELLVGGSGSSQVIGFTNREKSPLTALTQLAGRDSSIKFKVGVDLDGVVVPSSALSPNSGAPGSHGLLRTNRVTGMTQVDQTVNFVGVNALPAGAQNTWTGTLTVPSTGLYDLNIQTTGGQAQLLVDGQLAGWTFPLVSTTLSRLPTADGLANARASLNLTAGPHNISIVEGTAGFPPFLPDFTGPVQVRLTWVTPNMRQARINEAVAAARGARTAVVFAYDEGTEQVDRSSLYLPEAQDQLIEAVAAVNPRTVVVLNTGDPVLMPWVKDVRSILEMWYPGQEGGTATAQLLLGKANPGGKLPVTFPAHAEDTPVANSPLRYPGVNGQEYYSEGLLVGYRWYDAQGISPLFAFGHGLSYTTFGYRDLQITRPNEETDQVRARVRITNTGTRAGAEIAQLYLGDPSSAGEPPRQLRGFQPVDLQPGQSTWVTFTLDRRALSTWNTSSHSWVAHAGKYEIMVGSSSRDIRVAGDFTLG